MTRAEQMAAGYVLVWCAQCGKSQTLHAPRIPGIWPWLYQHRGLHRDEAGYGWKNDCYPEEIDMARRA